MYSFKKMSALALLLVIPAMLFAFGSAEDQAETVEQPVEQAQAADQPAADQPPAGQAMSAGDQYMHRLSDLVGSEWANEAGDFQGSIEDAVITTDGNITHLVVSVSEAEGEAAAVEQAPADGQVASGDQAAAPGTVPAEPGAPAATADQEVAQAEVQGDRYLVPVDRFTFGATADQRTVANFTQDELTGFDRIEDDQLPATISEADAQTIHLLGSRLMDYSVRNAADQDLGGIEDLMLDLQNHQVAYFALGAGGFLGIGEKLFAVPMSAISDVNTDDQTLVVNITEEQLRNNEGFDQDNWPNEAGAY
jgi:sporulation protein YlmC with PRC-barrel domain